MQVPKRILIEGRELPMRIIFSYAPSEFQIAFSATQLLLLHLSLLYLFSVGFAIGGAHVIQ